MSAVRLFFLVQREEVLFSRFYPIVEQRHMMWALQSNVHYSRAPPSHVLAPLFLSTLNNQLASPSDPIHHIPLVSLVPLGCPLLFVRLPNFTVARPSATAAATPLTSFLRPMPLRKTADPALATTCPTCAQSTEDSAALESVDWIPVVYKKKGDLIACAVPSLRLHPPHPLLAAETTGVLDFLESSLALLADFMPPVCSYSFSEGQASFPSSRPAPQSPASIQRFGVLFSHAFPYGYEALAPLTSGKAHVQPRLAPFLLPQPPSLPPPRTLAVPTFVPGQPAVGLTVVEQCQVSIYDHPAPVPKFEARVRGAIHLHVAPLHPYRQHPPPGQAVSATQAKGPAGPPSHPLALLNYVRGELGSLMPGGPGSSPLPLPSMLPAGPSQHPMVQVALEIPPALELRPVFPVQRVDGNISVRLPVSPPSAYPEALNLELARYQCPLAAVPIKCDYQMQADPRTRECHLMLQLKLVAPLPGPLEHCQVVFAFHGRPPIRSVEGEPTVGRLSTGQAPVTDPALFPTLATPPAPAGASKGRQAPGQEQPPSESGPSRATDGCPALVWDLGSLSSAAPKAALEAHVHFERLPEDEPLPESHEEAEGVVVPAEALPPSFPKARRDANPHCTCPFLIDTNSCAQFFFSHSGGTLSGLHVAGVTPNLTTPSPTAPSIITAALPPVAYTLDAGTYLAWNGFGAARVAVEAPELLQMPSEHEQQQGPEVAVSQ
ncbi:hypothetical protein PAPYR_4382 [Paratrimastix pyriformis]|uniref:Uncharacterized protein n=1 Tax=Paratrimastix pyriformis TaxID=342808 RepID=A0ABQ8UQL2_9EUKA|nr:hypothetical protein PAPYR_4382 [Paratrimastix pyriformis]